MLCVWGALAPHFSIKILITNNMLYLISFRDCEGGENLALAQGINLDMAEEHVEAGEHACQIHDSIALTGEHPISGTFPEKVFTNEEKQFFTKNKYLVIKTLP